MVRAGMCVATGVLATVAAWAGVAHFTTADSRSATTQPSGNAS